MKPDHDEHAECRREIHRLGAIVVRFYDELYALPELNMENYTTEQARELNDGVCDIFCWLELEAKQCREAAKSAKGE